MHARHCARPPICRSRWLAALRLVLTLNNVDGLADEKNRRRIRKFFTEDAADIAATPRTLTLTPGRTSSRMIAHLPGTSSRRSDTVTPRGGGMTPRHHSREFAAAMDSGRERAITEEAELLEAATVAEAAAAK